MPWTVAQQASLSLTIFWSLPKCMSIASVMPSSYLIFWLPLLLRPQSFPESETFPWVSCSHQMTKILEFQLQHQPFQRVKIDWFDLLAVQRTLRSLLQHHSSKASILPRFAFFIVQLSQPYMITGKTIALTIQTLVGREMSLCFNTLSRFVIAFLSRSNRLLISWLQSPSAVILEPKKRKPVTTPTFSPFYLPWSNGTRCHDLSF